MAEHNPQAYGAVARSGFLWGISGRGGNELVAVPTAMILARLLSPADFGVAAAAAFFVQIATSLTSFGFNAALVRLKDLREEHMCTVFWVNLAFCSFIWGLLVLASPWLGVVFRSEAAARVVPWAAFTIVLGAFASMPAVLLSREMRFQAIATLEVFVAVLSSAVSLVMAWLGFGVWSLIYPSLVGFGAQAVLRSVLTGWYPRLIFSRQALGDVFSFGVGLHAKRLLDTIAGNIDNLVVGRTLGMTGLGFYDKGFSTMNRAVSALNTVGPTVSYRILALIQDDAVRFRAAYRKLVITSTLIGYPILAGAAVAGHSIITVMFGERWEPAVVPFQVLCVAGMARMQNAYASTAIQSKGQVWGEVMRQVAYICLIVLGVFVGSQWGLPGAAVGVLGATVVMWGLMQALVRRVVGLRWTEMVASQMPALQCAGVVAGLVLGASLLLSHFVPGRHAVVLLLGEAVAGAMGYALFLLASPTPAVREVVDDTLRQFVPRLAAALGR